MPDIRYLNRINISPFTTLFGRIFCLLLTLWLGREEVSQIKGRVIGEPNSSLLAVRLIKSGLLRGSTTDK
jgi:hypothetical protein